MLSQALSRVSARREGVIILTTIHSAALLVALERSVEGRGTVLPKARSTSVDLVG